MEVRAQQSRAERRPGIIGTWHVAEAIMRWPGLSAGAKIAWLWLWNESQEGRRIITIRKVDLAVMAGSASSATRWLAPLVEQDLIVLRSVTHGRYEVEVLDLNDLVIARRRRGDGPQLELPLVLDEPANQADTVGLNEGVLARQDSASAAVDGTPSAEPQGRADRAVVRAEVRLGPAPLVAPVPQSPPEPAPEAKQSFGSGAGSEIRALRTPREDLENNKHLHLVKPRKSSRGGSNQLEGAAHFGSGAGSETGTGAAPIGDVLAGQMAELVEGLDRRALARQDRIQRLAEWIRTQFVHTVGDERLRLTPCLKLAAAVVDGQVTTTQVTEAIARTGDRQREGSLDCAWGFFVGCAKRLVQRGQSDWHGRRS